MRSEVRSVVPVVYVADQLRSQAFYELLGFTVSAEGDGDGDGWRWTLLRAGELAVMLATGAEAPQPDSGPAVLYVVLPAIDPVLAALRAAGHPIDDLRYPDHAPGGEARAADPDGHGVLLGQATGVPRAGHPGAAGAARAEPGNGHAARAEPGTGHAAHPGSRAGDRSAGDRSADDRSAGDRSAGGLSAGGLSAGDLPAGDLPAGPAAPGAADPEPGEARGGMLRAAAEAVARRGGVTQLCQVGLAGGAPCPAEADVKLADSWGDTAWACTTHADEVLVNARGAFIANEDAQGLAQFLRLRRLPGVSVG